MKNVIVSLMILLSGLLWSVEIEFEGDRVRIWGSFEITNQETIEIEGVKYYDIDLFGCGQGGKPEEFEIEHYTRLISLPENGNWRVSEISYDYEVLALDKPVVSNSRDKEFTVERNLGWYPENIVSIGEPVIMRNNRFSQVSIAGMQYNSLSNQIRIIKGLELELELDNSSSNVKTRTVNNGEDFNKLITGITGAENSRSIQNGSYLLITPDIPEVLEILEYYKRWKQKLGHEVYIATLTETGDTNEDIRDYLQNVYDTWENIPEFVVLIGDVSGNIVVPSWYIAGYLTAFDVTDHPYTLLEGDDYFPDVLIGRLSVQSLSELQTVIAKIINYESNPYLGSDWITKALMCSYILDIGGYYQMYSQRETVMAVRERLLDFTYTEVDTFISPFQSGASNLANMINTGYSFINYRGAGSPAYWSGGYGQMFSIWNFDLLQNGMMLPMVTSIVCGGGNFADTDYATCFGEIWLSAGTPQSPKGAIGFIGPSELDTKTPFNNCNDMGIYQGITQEEIYGSAAMMLRGKMELYNNYPDCHEMDGYNDAWDSDMFYFYVYNLLGDPGLEVMTRVPEEIEAVIPEEISAVSSQLEISILNGNMDEFTAALTLEGNLFAVSKSDLSGNVLLNVPAELDSFEVTLSCYGYIPLISMVRRSNEIEEVTVTDYSFSSIPETGEEIELNIELTNSSSNEIEFLEIEIESNDEFVEIDESVLSLSNFAAGAVEEIGIGIVFSENWRATETGQLMIKFNDGDFGSYILNYEVETAQIEYLEHEVNNEENAIFAGIENEIDIELYNAGQKDSGEFTVILTSLDDKCSIPAAYSDYSSILAQGSGIGNGSFIIIPDGNVLDGEPMLFDLMVVQSNQPVWETHFQMTAGSLSEESPTFSEYGYYAIESSDIGNFQVPEYSWIEASPEAGGSGALVPESHVTSDGFSTCIELPFQFCYYGIYYNEITVSSNGWLSMGEEEYVFFRNRTIPSGVGSSAMIAPFWDEMSDGEIYVWYNSYDHYFVIEWYEFWDANHSNYQTFEVILYDPEYYSTASGDGEIKFQYKEIHNSNQGENYSTTGIENHSQTEGLLLSYANRYPETMHEITDETAILITIKEGSPVPQLAVDASNLSFALQPDTCSSFEISLENLSVESGIEYEVFISQFPRGEEGRDLSGDSINLVNSLYYTGHEMDLYLFLVHDSPDNEGVGLVSLFFPDYINVTGATDIAGLEYNGETGYGASVQWGGNGNYSYNGTTPQTFHVYFTIDSGITSPIPIDWGIIGDQTGSEPHDVWGTVTLMPSDEEYLWVEYPNGGEELAFSVNDTIRWSSYGDIGNVDIYYTDNYFVNYTVVAENAENTGEYEWTIPGMLTESGKIRVRESDGNEYDDSDGFFAIRGLVITYPNSETILEYGQEAEILWDFSGGTSTVAINYTTTDGMIWHSLTDEAPNTGSYQFTVDMEPSDACKIRLITYGEEMIVSEMEGTFSVVSSPINWLSIESAIGSLEPMETQSLEFEIDTSNMETGRYQAYITIISEYGQKIAIPVELEILNTESNENEIVAGAVLGDNYPNPFYIGGSRGETTTISFSIKKFAAVKLSLYNIKGQLVREFIDEELGGGNYDISWDGRDIEGNQLSSGVYFYQLQVNDKIAANKKCLLLK